MIAVNFDSFVSPSRKREANPLWTDEQPNEQIDSLPVMVKRRRRLLNDPVESPVVVNRARHLQYENEILELRLTLEKKEKELAEKNQRIQYLENQLSSCGSKVQQFDTLAKTFMDQNSRLKQKEEEVSNLSSLVQKLVFENKGLKNQLILMDKERIINMLGN